MMTHKHWGQLLCAALLLLLGACQKAPQITMTTSPTIDLPADGSSGTITFTANRDWTASSSESWVHVSPASGPMSKDPVTVTVRCDANTTFDDRTATVTIKAEDAVQSVTVRQPQNLGIVVPTQTFNIKADTKSLDVEVQANVEYSIEISADWIRLPYTKGLSSTRYTFSVNENTTYDSRSATITITPKNSSAQSEIISVKQAAKDGLLVKKTEYTVGPDGGTLEIAVQANVEFEVKPGTDWIHYTQTKALVDKTVILSIDRKGTIGRRNGEILISQKDGVLSTKIKVNQLGQVTAGEVIDLGLSVKWRSWNLGATKPEEYGDYYAWGETNPKDDYTWETYKFRTSGDSPETVKFSKYNTKESYGPVDNKTVLDPEDDAAHIVLGGNWRMPTDEEWTELITRTQCAWTWTTLNGVNGYIVESKSNGNSIFLPAAGSRYVTNLYNAGSHGNYWSSSLNTNSPIYARGVGFVYRGIGYRNIGESVRPVSE